MANFFDLFDQLNTNYMKGLRKVRPYLQVGRLGAGYFVTKVVSGLELLSLKIGLKL